MTASSSISELAEPVRSKCREFIKLCKAQGISISINSTYRSCAYQRDLIARYKRGEPGISKPATPGRSLHNYRFAFDFTPSKKGFSKAALQRQCGAIGESLGLTWGGSFNDPVHLDGRKFKTVDQFIAEVGLCGEGAPVPPPENPVGIEDGPAQTGDYAPPAANLSKSSDAKIALWTNRVPQHEPWPRVMKGDTPASNKTNDEHEKNVNHNDQFGDDAAEHIGRVEGEDEIVRGKFWRR